MGIAITALLLPWATGDKESFPPIAPVAFLQVAAQDNARKRRISSPLLGHRCRHAVFGIEVPSFFPTAMHKQGRIDAMPPTLRQFPRAGTWLGDIRQSMSYRACYLGRKNVLFCALRNESVTPQFG